MTIGQKIWMWFLVTLTVAVSVLFGLEILGQSQVRPSTWVQLNQDALTIEELTKRVEKLEDSAESVDKRITDVSNKAFVPNLPNSNSVQPQIILTFEDCVKSGGNESAGVVSKLSSQVCFLEGKYFRPDEFELTREKVVVKEKNDDFLVVQNGNREDFSIAKSLIANTFNSVQTNGEYRLSAEVQSNGRSNEVSRVILFEAS